MGNLLRSVEFWKGIVVGLLTAVLTLATIFGPRIVRLSDTWKQAVELTQRRAERCELSLAELEGSATVLYEWQRGEGIQVLGGLVELQPGSTLGGAKAYGQSLVRWYIPVKVKPWVYGDNHGAAFAWYNRGTNRWEGPYAAEAPSH